MMIKFLTLVAAIGIPAVAAAQAAESPDPPDFRNEARGHIGPFYLTPRVLLKELGIDSNVFNEAGEQQSDFTFTLTPKLDVWVPFARRALLKTALGSDLVWYADYESERSINPNVTTRGEVYLNRITLFGERGYVNTRERANYEMDLRPRHTEDTLTAGVSVAPTAKFSIELSARQLDLRYDEDAEVNGSSLQRTLNRESRGLQVLGRHRLTALTTLAVRYDILRDRFEFSPARDSNSYRVMPGVEFAPQALLKGRAYIGYRQFTPTAPGFLPPFSGLVGDLGLSYTLLDATTFGINYRRDLEYSYSEQQPFFVDNAIGASVRRALGNRFDVLLSSDRHEYRYHDALIVEIDAVSRVDVTWNYAASLGFRVGRDGRIGFGVAYATRESTDPSRTYDTLRAGTTVSYGF